MAAYAVVELKNGKMHTWSSDIDHAWNLASRKWDQLGVVVVAVEMDLDDPDMAAWKKSHRESKPRRKATAHSLSHK